MKKLQNNQKLDKKANDSFDIKLRNDDLLYKKIRSVLSPKSKVKKRNITVYVSQHLLEELEIVCAKYNLTKSALIEVVIEIILESQ